VDSKSTLAGRGETNLSQLYLSRLSLALPAKLNSFKTPASGHGKRKTIIFLTGASAVENPLTAARDTTTIQLSKQ
jgi:4-aminobutyrate aminotransferase-like enzyme